MELHPRQHDIPRPGVVATGGTSTATFTAPNERGPVWVYFAAYEDVAWLNNAWIRLHRQHRIGAFGLLGSCDTLRRLALE